MRALRAGIEAGIDKNKHSKTNKENCMPDIRTSLIQYMNQVGKKSFILQVVLVNWTIAVFFFTIVSLISISYNARYSEGTTLFALCFLFGVWIFVAFPLGIAALVTMGSDKKKNE
jgi:hypothetical protein